MRRVKVMDHFWNSTIAVTGAGGQSQTEEQEKAFSLLAEFLRDTPPPLRAMPALADLLIAAYDAGRASR